jgi:hypothetical protein
MLTTLVFVSLPKIALSKVLCGKTPYHGGKSAWLAKLWSFLTNALPECFKSGRIDCLVDSLFWRDKFAVDNSFVMKYAYRRGFDI